MNISLTTTSQRDQIKEVLVVFGMLPMTSAFANPPAEALRLDLFKLPQGVAKEGRSIEMGDSLHVSIEICRTVSRFRD